MTKNTHIYSGKAYCNVQRDNPEYSKGMRGAFIPICCKARSLVEAVSIIQAELLEHRLGLEGVENFFNEKHFDQMPTEGMLTLISRLDTYPVQFDEVHYFPPDS